MTINSWKAKHNDEPVADFELIDHGIDYEQYFQGCGTGDTDYANVVTGIGDTLARAIDDCMEQIAEMGVDADDLEDRILKREGMNGMIPTTISVAESHPDAHDAHHYVSILWNWEND